jgi:Tol biopolymer transport system component
VRASLATGVLVYRSSSGAACQLTWVNRKGELIARVGDPHDLPSIGLDLSPDDTRVVLDRGIDGSRDILILETMRVGATRLTDDPKFELSPVWSHDGQRVAFNSNRSGAFQIFERAANGSGIDKVLLSSSQTVLVAEDWSDAFLLYRKVENKTGRDLWVLPVSAAGPSQPFAVVDTRFEEREGQFSPNGKWIAYASNRLGHSEIYAQPFPGTEGAKPVSSGGGSQPRWRSDGTELFYIALDNQLKAVKTTFGPNGQSLQLGPPEVLFPSRIADPGPVRTHLYAVARDGQRFLIEQTTDEGTATLTVVLNWRPAK